MAYYDALKARWGELSGTTTEQKLAAINAQTVAGPNTPVPVITLTTYLRENGLWLPIKAAAAAGASLGAEAAIDYNSDPRTETMDMSLGAVQAMLADLVSHSLLTQAQSDAIAGMGTPPMPWWQANGYTSPFTQADLDAAGGLS